MFCYWSPLLRASIKSSTTNFKTISVHIFLPKCFHRLDLITSFPFIFCCCNCCWGFFLRLKWTLNKLTTLGFAFFRLMCIKKILWTRLKWDIESFEYILNRWTHQNTWNYSSVVLMMMCSVLLVEQYARLARTLTHLRSMMLLLRKFIWEIFAVK